MKKFGLIFYTLLYLLGLFSFVVNSLTDKYKILGILTFAITFISSWIILFIKQANERDKDFIRKLVNFDGMDIKNKLSVPWIIYFYISTIMFLIIVIGSFILSLSYGHPEIINGGYVTTSHGTIIRNSITKFEFKILTFFNSQIFVCISLLLNSGIIIYLKDRLKKI